MRSYPKLETLLRGKDPNTKRAWEFASSMVAGQSQQALDIALAFARSHQNRLEADFPGYKGFPDQATPDAFRIMVQEVLGSLSGIFFPAGAEYVQGDIIKMLVPLYTHLQKITTGADLTEPMSIVVANTLFLRGLTGAISVPLLSLPQDQTGSKAVRLTLQILTFAVNRSPGGKDRMPAELHPDVEKTYALADSFLQTVVARVATQATQQKAPKDLAATGTGL
jgi:hypothetical protein